MLECLFPDDFKDCSYIRYNVSTKKKIITESQRKAVSQYMNFDTELHEIANNYLDATLDRLYPDPNERQRYLKDFKKRCQAKRRRQSFIDTAKSFEHSIKKAVMKMIKR